MGIITTGTVGDGKLLSPCNCLVQRLFRWKLYAGSNRQYVAEADILKLNPETLASSGARAVGLQRTCSRPAAA